MEFTFLGLLPADEEVDVLEATVWAASDGSFKVSAPDVQDGGWFSVRQVDALYALVHNNKGEDNE